MAIEEPLVVFRVAAGPRVGAGHLHRCLALADAVQRRGATTLFAINEDALTTAPALAEAGAEVFVVEAGGGDVAPADEGAPKNEIDLLYRYAGRRPDWIVFDHYRRGVVYEQLAEASGVCTLAIDDLVRAHAASIVLDPAPGRTSDAYRSASPDSLILTGPAFAPLKPQIAAARLRREQSQARRDPSASFRILVSLGGADPDGATVRVLEALRFLGASVAVTVVVGGATPHLTKVQDECARTGARLITDAPDMASLVVEADLAIGAGGVSALERCCIGTPSVLVAIADNQRATLDGLIAAGACVEVGAGALPHDLPKVLRALLADADARRRMAEAGRRLCDGAGAHRAAGLMLAPHRDAVGRPVHLRPADAADAQRLFEWQSEAGARRYARNPEPPTWPQHCAWLDSTLQDDSRRLRIVLCGDRPVGMVRLDRLERPPCGAAEAGDCAAIEVSLLIAQALSGRGVGRAALRAAEEDAVDFISASGSLAPVRLFAYIRDENEASLRVFAAAGYRHVGGGWFELSRTKSPLALSQGGAE